MNKSEIKNSILNLSSSVPKWLIENLYSKPKLLVRAILNTKQLLEESYFPELPRKSSRQIIAERLWTIIRYGTIDEYYYMYGLDVKRNVKNTEYVNYNEFSKSRDEFNLSYPHNDSSILRNKLFFESVAKTLGIPTTDNVAYSNEGRLYLLGKKNISKPIDWGELSLCLNDGILYVKPIDGQCGAGIFKIKIKDHKIILKNEEIDGNTLKEICGNGIYLFQKELIQHPEMARLYPNSVNTIRMTTIRNTQNNQIEVLPPTLRVGAHGSYVDNFSKGGVIIAMDAETGKLSEWGFFKPQYGFKSKTHPDTDIPFSTFAIPFYQEAKEMALYFHSFLNLHSIGWDIAITDNGPMFIEGNDNWEINLPQTFETPFRKEFNRLYKK